MSTNDTETAANAIPGWTLRGSGRRAVRRDAAEGLAGRTHEVDGRPSRRSHQEPQLSARDRDALVALDERFWERRSWEINNALPLSPWQLNRDVGSVAALIDTLEKARLAELKRCQSSHFAASLPRYNGIKYLLIRERALLDRLTREVAS